MKKWIEKNIDIEHNYNKIITKGLKTILIYFILSSIWILYSDRLLESIVKDIVMLNRMQSMKGILFVILTSLFMMVLVQRYNNLLYQLNQAYAANEIKMKELMVDNKKNELYHLLTKYLTETYDTSESIAIDVFRYIYERIGICDKGSVLMIKDDDVTFIDTIGYDMKKLNALKIPADKIDLFTVGIYRNKLGEKRIIRKLGPEKYKTYHEFVEPLKESIYIGLVDNKNQILGISIDISEKHFDETQHNFSDQMVKELKEIQFLITSIFKIKNLVGMKHILQSDIVSSFIAALEYHDEYTKGHSIEVAQISDKIGRELNLNEEQLSELHWAALIHDLGKIVIPKEVLNKPSDLTDEEYLLVKQHSENGEKFLSKAESLKKIAVYVRHHHERYDGKGYPDQLMGEEIPLVSRIITVADSYHAMTSNRPYRQGLSKTKALEELVNNEGKQFCPQVVEAFLRMRDKVYE